MQFFSLLEQCDLLEDTEEEISKVSFRAWGGPQRRPLRVLGWLQGSAASVQEPLATPWVATAAHHTQGTTEPAVLSGQSPAGRGQVASIVLSHAFPRL